MTANRATVIEAPDGPIMVIAAHPDDIESWCAGTLARSIDRGATVRLLLVTSGDKGSSEPTDTASVVAKRREREAGEAARHLGLTDVAFLRYADGEVENTHALRGDLVAYLRRWRPAVVFTFDPEHPLPPYLSHHDHRAVGRAALDAIYPLARDRLAFPAYGAQGLTIHAVAAVWLFASARADMIVDISAGFERKLAARLAHMSQTGNADLLRTGWRERAAQIGAPVGVPLAEAFTVLHLD